MKWELPASHTSHQIKFTLLTVLYQQICLCWGGRWDARRKNRTRLRIWVYLCCFKSNCFLVTKAVTSIIIASCFFCNCFKSCLNISAIRFPRLRVSLEPIKFIFPGFRTAPGTKQLLSIMKSFLIIWMGLRITIHDIQDYKFSWTSTKRIYPDISFFIQLKF